MISNLFGAVALGGFLLGAAATAPAWMATAAVASVGFGVASVAVDAVEELADKHIGNHNGELTLGEIGNYAQSTMMAHTLQMMANAKNLAGNTLEMMKYANATSREIINQSLDNLSQQAYNIAFNTHESYQEFKQWLAEVPNNIKDIHQKTVSEIADILDFTKEQIKEFIDIANKTFDNIWDNFRQKFEEIFEKFQDFSKDFFYDNIYDWLPASFKEWFEMNRDGFHTFYDPLILDLDGNGISTFALNSNDFKQNAFFDFDNDGISHATGWTTDGFLVRDINKDGVINNGSEVFGDHTLKQDGTKAKHGFNALSDLDSNHDGKIDKQDLLFKELKVWQDSNKNGISEQQELKTLDQFNIDSLNLNYHEPNQTLQGGRLFQLATYTKTDGSTHQMGDVDFNFSHTFSQYANRLDTSKIGSMMDLAGRGKVRSLLRHTWHKLFQVNMKKPCKNLMALKIKSAY